MAKRCQGGMNAQHWVAITPEIEFEIAGIQELPMTICVSAVGAFLSLIRALYSAVSTIRSESSISAVWALISFSSWHILENRRKSCAYVVRGTQRKTPQIRRETHHLRHKDRRGAILL
ncbi:MAG: hypothetical protein GY822_03260 [Deltaproteobacteria bacterium]|nr:hypothetical protein [Deltaproteobacteria bacterium]